MEKSLSAFLEPKFTQPWAIQSPCTLCSNPFGSCFISYSNTDELLKESKHQKTDSQQFSQRFIHRFITNTDAARQRFKKCRQLGIRPNGIDVFLHISALRIQTMLLNCQQHLGLKRSTIQHGVLLGDTGSSPFASYFVFNVMVLRIYMLISGLQAKERFYNSFPMWVTKSLQIMLSLLIHTYGAAYLQSTLQTLEL